jgi:capsular polysaccharide biosynthesis protein
MELKEYIVIFRKNIKLFFVILGTIILAGILFQLFRPLSFRSTLNLNVTRIGTQKTDSYRYDDYYRLQADEKFADTVVNWLGSPRIATDIFNSAGIISAGLSDNELSKIFKARRLSSQMIQVTYVAKDMRSSQKFSEEIIKILNNETEKLNQLQKEEAWFTILGGNPVVVENKFAFLNVILISFFLGIFIGTLAVFVKNYLK